MIMKMWIGTLMAAAPLILLGGATRGQPPQPTEQARSMQSMLADVNAIRAFVYGSGKREDARAAAEDLLAWSNRLAALFPPGQASDQYVDMSAERARNAPIASRREADKLLAVVRNGKISAVGDQLIVMERSGCGACHLSTVH
jgi:cytochrome c556